MKARCAAQLLVSAQTGFELTVQSSAALISCSPVAHGRPIRPTAGAGLQTCNVIRQVNSHDLLLRNLLDRNLEIPSLPPVRFHPIKGETNRSALLRPDGKINELDPEGGRDRARVLSFLLFVGAPAQPETLLALESSIPSRRPLIWAAC